MFAAEGTMHCGGAGATPPEGSGGGGVLFMVVGGDLKVTGRITASGGEGGAGALAPHINGCSNCAGHGGGGSGGGSIVLLHRGVFEGGGEVRATGGKGGYVEGISSLGCLMVTYPGYDGHNGAVVVQRIT